MSLPQRLPLPQMQTRWSTALDPIIANPLVQGHLLTGVVLINGTTVVNHLLGRRLQGWMLAGINAAATIYDNQATNQTPQLTLSLTSNAACTVSLWVF